MNDLLSKYTMLKRPLASEISIRPGFYVPMEFISVERNETNWIINARALWSDDPSFNKCICVEVNLSPLYNKRSDGPCFLHPTGLLASKIAIKVFDIINDSFNNEDYTSYKVFWDIIASFKNVENELSLYSKNRFCTKDIIDIREAIELGFMDNEHLLDYYQEMNHVDETEQLLIDEYQAENQLDIENEALLDDIQIEEAESEQHFDDEQTYGFDSQDNQ